MSGPGDPPGTVQLRPVTGIGEVSEGDDLADTLLQALAAAGAPLLDGDVLAVSSKVVAKALGLWRADRDTAVAEETVAVVAERATETGTARIVRSAAGPVMAAAGVDASNLGPRPGGAALVLPRDPDTAARALRSRLLAATGVGRLGVVLTDTAGRPWRHGQGDIALGAAGVAVVEDLRGGRDADGHQLEVTVRALADELAAAAELVKGKAGGVPAVVVRGLAELCTVGDGPGAAGLVRTGTADWFRYGAVDAVRASLGCPPGTPDVPAAPAVLDGDAAAVLARAVAVVDAGRAGDPELAGVSCRTGSAGMPIVDVRADVQADVRAEGDQPPEDALVPGRGAAGAVAPARLVAAARVAERVRVAAAAEHVACEVTLVAGGLRVQPVPARA